MRILIACESSGRVREAFRKLGHDAVSVDILPAEDDSPFHVQDDVTSYLKLSWDMVIGFPPCTDLSAANAHLLKVKAADGRTERAYEFFRKIYDVDSPRVAVENPAGVLSTIWRKPDQYIQPWWFGEPYKKRTGLWLRGLPKLIGTHTLDMYPEGVGYYHHGSGYNAKHLGIRKGKAYNASDRSRTFQSIADAMATQWGKL